MEINEMKKKILKKLEQDKEALSSNNDREQEKTSLNENALSVSENEKLQFQAAVTKLTDGNERLAKELSESRTSIESLEDLLAQKEETDADKNEKTRDEIRNLKTEKNEIERENDILNENLLSMKSEAGKKDVKLSKLESLLREKEEKLNTELRSEIEDVLSEIKLKFQMEESMTQLKAEVDSKNQKLNEILLTTENEIKALKDERDSLKDILEDRDKKEKELEDEVATYKVEITTRDSKIEADSKYYNELVKAAEETKREALLEIEKAAKKSDPELHEPSEHKEKEIPEDESNLRKKLDERIADLEQEFVEKETWLQQKLDEKEQEYKLTLARMESEINEKTESIARLEESIKKKNAQLQKSLPEHDKEIFEEIITQLESEIKQKDGKIEESSEEFKVMLSRIEDNFKKNEVEKNEHERLKSIIEEKDTALNKLKQSLTARADKLGSLLSEKNENISRLEKEIKGKSGLQEKIDRLEKEKGATQTEGQDALQETLKELNRLKADVVQNDSALNKLKRGLEARTDELESLLSEKNENISRLEKELKGKSGLQEKINRLEKEKGTSQTEGQDALQETLKELNRLKADVQGKNKEVLALKNKCADMDKLIDWKKDVDENFATLQNEFKESLAGREDLEKELVGAMSMVEEVYALLQDAETDNGEE